MFLYIYHYVAIFWHGTSLKKKTSSHVWTRTCVAGLCQQTCYALDHHVTPKKDVFNCGQMFFFNDVPWQNIDIYIYIFNI